MLRSLFIDPVRFRLETRTLRQLGVADDAEFAIALREATISETFFNLRSRCVDGDL